MLLDEKVTRFSRTVANELKKGYYPTFPSDVTALNRRFRVYLPYERRKNVVWNLAILDPCAGEGAWLASAKRAIMRAKTNERFCTHSYAVELDETRCRAIKGTREKLCGSFFEVTASGKFDAVLLNPPYRSGANDLKDWLKKANAMRAYQGVLIFIVPEYEWLKEDMQKLIDEDPVLSIQRVWRSSHYNKFKQVIACLGKRSYSSPAGPIPTGPIDEEDGFHIDLTTHKNPCPILSAKFVEKEYDKAFEVAARGASDVLTRLYPAAWNDSVEPAVTLRKAHAVQLAALGSETAGVEIDGSRYLARYWVRESVEEFDDPDSGGKTIVRRPVVEPVFLNEAGTILGVREVPCGNSNSLTIRNDLVELLLGRIQDRFRVGYEIGSRPDYLRETSERIGLMAPQAESVRGVVHAFATGKRGMILIGPTGSGKTYCARGIIEAMGKEAGTVPARRVLFLTEAHLPVQVQREFQDAGFKVYLLDSLQKVVELCRGPATAPGVYLISYGRFRRHPKPVATVERTNGWTGSGGERTWSAVQRCEHCGRILEKGERPKGKATKQTCSCGNPLWTYKCEGKKTTNPSFARWVEMMESGQFKHHRGSSQVPYLRWLKAVPWDLFLVDESHGIGNAASNQGSAFLRIASRAKHVVSMTATVANGYASSWFNQLWGVTPMGMKDAGYDRNSVTDFQLRFGATKEIYKAESGNRHRTLEYVRTSDAPGISPKMLGLVLPNLVTMAGEDFTDLPPVIRTVHNVDPDPEVAGVEQEIEQILDRELAPEDRRCKGSLKALAFLRAPDTFCHADDPITLRGQELGVVRQRACFGLTPKEEVLVREVRESVDRGERVLVFVENTQKIDLRPVLAEILRREAKVSVDVLTDNISAKKVVRWFEEIRNDVTIAAAKRCGVGLNLSQYTHLIWYQQSTNPRLVAQGEGRILRVNSAMLHRQWWGEVRPVRYTYLVSGIAQNLCLAYTTEKRLVSRLSEGEVPEFEMDSDMGAVVGQSFASVLTRALQSGGIQYQDPSEMLRKMSEAENRKIVPVAVVPPPCPARPKAPTPCVPRIPVAQPSTKPEQLSMFGLF